MSHHVTYRATLPVAVRFDPEPDDASTGERRWAARLPNGVPVGRYGMLELRDAGVDVDRLRLWGEGEAEYQARRIHETLGVASACWERLENAGVFQSERALAAAADLMADLGIIAPEGYRVPVPGPDRGRVESYDWVTADRPEPVVHRETRFDPDVEVTEFTVDAATGDEFVELVTQTVPGPDPVEYADQVSGDTRRFYESTADEPETMFAGTEPQAPVDGLDSPRAVRVAANAIGWIAAGGDPDATEGTVTIDEDQQAVVWAAAERAVDHLRRFVDDPDAVEPLEPSPVETPPGRTGRWSDVHGAPLDVGDEVGLVDTALVGLLEVGPSNFPDATARVRAANGATRLVIPHRDVEAR